MARGRFLAPIQLSSAEAQQLTSLARSRSYPFSIVQRAQIVLACAQGHTNKAVAARLDVSPRTVSKWRQRFVAQGVAGLHDATRPGRPREIDDERVMELLNQTLQHTPDDATHKHPKVRTWLVQRPRFHVHFTPTYASWLNQVERWFAHITDRAIRRGSFKSVNDLAARMDRFVEQHNAQCAPFVWYASADSILRKIERLCERISVTGH